MREETEIRKELKVLIRKYFTEVKKRTSFVPGKTVIPLIVPAYDWDEVCEALDSLLDTQVTMGRKVKQFESMFAEYIGTRFATMVNSGSSANLLALAILTNPLVENHLKPGDEIITPAVTWATTVFPILQFGLIPMLVDIDLDTFNLNINEVEKAITEKTRAIMLVHLLGNPCDMGRLTEIAQRHNLFIIEDTCEAHGAEFNRRKVGSFGDLATFSFFFSHHITTIEGGMVLTSNEEFAELARALRAFGWIRELKNKDKIAEQYQDIDPKFLFVNIGYNLRPTEIQGAFGMHQLGKLDKFIEMRRENSAFWTKNLGKYEEYLLLHKEREETRHVWFGYPITVKPGAPFTRKELTSFLTRKGLETRPIMAGNIDEQPAMKLANYHKVGNLENSRLIMRNSFFFGNHHGIDEAQREAIIGYIDEFMAEVIGGT